MRDLLCHLSRFTVAALVALSTAIASAQTRPPDSVPSKMDLPPEVREWFRNPDGSCVQCSIGMCGVWCNVPAASTLLWDTPYGKAVRGGSWPDRVADYCERRQIKAFNITGDTTWEWMEWAARTGRFAAIGAGRAHFQTEYGRDPANGRWYVCNNNSPRRVDEYTNDEFHRLHLASGKWVVISMAPHLRHRPSTCAGGEQQAGVRSLEFKIRFSILFGETGL